MQSEKNALLRSEKILEERMKYMVDDRDKIEKQLMEKNQQKMSEMQEKIDETKQKVKQLESQLK